MKKELTVSTSVEKMDEILDFVNTYLEEMDCPMKVQTQLDIAIDELFSNICYYAYGGKAGEAMIVIDSLSDPHGVTLTFIDSGVPYNPLEKEDPDVNLGVNERQIGGLGIFIVKKTMDDISYVYEDNKNKLTIKKYF